MKLSTLTTDLGLILDYSETNNIELYDNILSELGNSGTDKDDIRKITIVRLILTEFIHNLKFQAMFDYNRVELKKVLSALNTRETYLIIWNEICDITDITEFEYNIKNDDIVLQSSMNNQQTVEQAVQQAKAEGSYKTRKETDAQTARRMNISVPQLLTLRGLKEKDRLSLKKEMNTKDKAGKNAKTKVVKFVTFNENFDKGFVSLEYPKLKGWLPISMGASEFFRKTNTKVRKLTAAEVKAQQAKQQQDFTAKNIALDKQDYQIEKDNQEYYGDFDGIDEDADDFDENSWDEMNATKGFENLSDEDEDDFVDYSDNAKHQIPTQQFIEQKIQEAQEAGDIVEPKVIKEETEAAKARRMNITVPQMRTLEAIKEKDRLSLKTPMSTKDKSGKNAKTKVMKFISFNPKFDKGMVFLEYPHLKGWLVTSMGASEFFRKFNVRLKSA